MPSVPKELSHKVARQVLTQTLRVKPGESVTIEAWSESLPWAVPFVTEARRLGAHPLMLYEDEAAFWEALQTGASRATGVVGSHEWSALDETDAYVFFFGPSQWPRYDDLPDRKTEGVAAYNAEWYKRAAKAKIRGARMYLGRTSKLAAERWDYDLGEWRTALAKASLASPADMHRLGSKLGARMARGKKVRVTHPNGTDVQFRLGRFPIQLDDGLVDAQDVKSGNNIASIPGGVVGVAVDHTWSRGSIVGNHTCYPNAGPADGIRWDFRGGHLADRSFKHGGEAFNKAFKAAPPKGRDRLSYFSIGLNPELVACPQMEDQEMGAVLFRLGGNSFVGGKNPSPFASWMVVTGADVEIDGKTVVEGGQVR